MVKKSSVGGRVRYYRNIKNLTINELAVKCGIAKDRLISIESDKVEMTVKELRIFCSSVKIRPDYFMSYHECDECEIVTRQLVSKLHKLENEGFDLSILNSEEVLNKLIFIYKFSRNLENKSKELHNDFLEIVSGINNIDRFKASLKARDISLYYGFNEVLKCVETFYSFDEKLKALDSDMLRDYKSIVSFISVSK